MKRKYKLNRHGSGRNRVVRWWFVLRGDEVVMKQLEEYWSKLAMQVDWKLEPLLTYTDTNIEQLNNEDQTSLPQSAPVSPPSPSTQSNHQHPDIPQHSVPSDDIFLEAGPPQTLPDQ